MKISSLYDKDFRKNLIADPKSTLQQISDGVEVKVVKNTQNVIYVVMPSNNTMSGNLDNIQAAGCVGSAGCATTIGTTSTICGTVGSASSASTLGTAGSA